MVPLWTNFDIHLEWLINLLYDRQLQFPIPNRSLLGRQATSSVYEFSKEEASLTVRKVKPFVTAATRSKTAGGGGSRVMSTFQKDCDF